jgi:hypothetical protein
VESLILKDFRCFAGLQQIPLRPVTILVGENSTGKTSFLAAARIAEQLRLSLGPPAFASPPFDLGAFDEVANYRGRKAGRAASFRIGSTYQVKIPREPESTLAENQVEFVRQNGRPFLKQFDSSLDGYRISVTFADEGRANVVVYTPSNSQGLLIEIESPPVVQDVWQTVQSVFFGIISRLSDDAVRKQDVTDLERIAVLLPAASAAKALPYVTAPIRAQPKRTYELLDDTPQPQGEHVPMLLAQMYGRKEWEEIRRPLERFAKASGLFDEVIVKRLGKSESSPFQIHVKLGGPPRNLIDVGYGVSQVLPLLVDLLRDKRQRMYLFQQPEVHLHPRAQAELGTLLAGIAKSHSKQLLIETHSDYIIDRIRMDVRDKRAGLRAEDVIILYFERTKGGVTIYPIELDGRANLRNVPPSYRGFFLDEEKRFLWVS